MSDFTILAHNYVREEVQEMADFVGDSLELARMAREVETEYIVFAGVDFMAEMAAILNPTKKVIHPEPFSRCAMALRLTQDDIMNARREYPDAAVVTYINSSAAVKAVSDIVCTSSNAVRVVNSLEQERIIFAPDRNLAEYVAKRTDKEIVTVPELGCCPVHHALDPVEIRKLLEINPDAEVIVHPETPQEVQELAHFIGSTSQMIKRAKESPSKTIIVGTEVGILFRMRRIAPAKEFIPASTIMACPDMKMINVEKVKRAIRERGPVVKVDEKIAENARKALERMMEVS